MAYVSALAWAAHATVESIATRSTQANLHAATARLWFIAPRISARSVHGLHQVFDHLLRIAEHHHRLFHVEQRIVEAGVTRRHRPLVHHDISRLVRLDDRHTVDGA